MVSAIRTRPSAVRLKLDGETVSLDEPHRSTVQAALEAYQNRSHRSVNPIAALVHTLKRIGRKEE